MIYFEQILSTFYGIPWAILPERLVEMESVLLKLVADRFTGRVAAFDDDKPKPNAQAKDYAAPGDVAIIPIRGTIYPRGNASPASGLTTAEWIGKQVDGAAANSQIAHIVLDMDTPGGAVAGIPEVAAKVRAAAERKPVTAVGNHLIASAGYWIASQAREIVGSPSSTHGSIGVKYVHADRSKMLEKDGISVTEITTAPMKAAASPFKPLSDEAKRAIENNARHWHEKFVSAVAAGRRVSVDRVETQFGRGDVLNAEDAKAAGMIDRIATLEQVVADIRARGARNRIAAMV